jgi:release factor glutamine methyltransferase
MKVKEAIQKLQNEYAEFLPNINSDIIRIMEYTLEINETGVLSKTEEELTQKQAERFEKILERVKTDEPIEYIMGTGHFYGHRYAVTKDTLIPRPETEVLVDLSLSELSYKIYDPDAKEKEMLKILDVGTGTGCIIISLVLALKTPAKFYASEKSAQALKIANRNIKDANLEEIITIFQSDLFENIPKDKKFDLIIANLPYISPRQYQKLPKSVKDYEPREALVAENRGKKTIIRALEEAKNRLNPKGVIILEMDPSQIHDVANSAGKIYPNSKVIISPDLSGKERFLTIKT